MARSRRGFSRRANHSAVNPVTDQNPSLAEVAKKLGINVEVLRRWTASTQAKGKEAIPEKDNLSPVDPKDKEYQRLLAENARLQMECDILRKANEFFANLPK